MPNNLQNNDRFPDIMLMDHNFVQRKISYFTRPSEMDRLLGFDDGYPLIVVFYRGFYCPRDQRQFKTLVEFQGDLAVNYCKMVSISTETSKLQAAFRAGLGAQWSFLSDSDRQLVEQLDILDETEGEYAFPALPYTYVLKPDLTVHKIYNGWFFVGRPTLDELRQDLRAIMSELSFYPYETYNDPEVKRVRIPQQTWLNGTPELGANGLPTASGVVSTFNLQSGNGHIQSDDGRSIFFNFTAIPGEGYRVLKPGTKVRFEVDETNFGLVGRNIQAQS